MREAGDRFREDEIVLSEDDRHIVSINGRELTRPIWVPKGVRYDPVPVELFRDWCYETLVFTEGWRGGQPIEWADFQVDEIIRPVFGLYDTRGPTPQRLIQVVYAFLPRGHAKTALAAVIGLYDLCGQWGSDIVHALSDVPDVPPGAMAGHRMTPEVDLYAESREQADRMWSAVQALITHGDSGLGEQVHILAGTKRARGNASAGVMVVRSGRAKGEVGAKPSTMFLDEVHSQSDDKLFAVLESSMGKRPDCLWMQMTTATPEIEAWAEKHHRAMLRLADNPAADPTTLVVVHQAPEGLTDEQIGDEALWREVAPALDAGFLDIAVYRREYAAAVADPVKMAKFRAWRLNEYSASPTAFIVAEAWDRARSEAPPDEEELAAAPSYIGIDTSLTGDITSVAVATYLDDGRVWLEWAHWVTPATQEKLRTWTHGEFAVWEADADLRVRVTDGHIIPVAEVVAYARAVCGMRNVVGIGFDSFRSAALNEGLSGLPIQQLNSAAWALRAAVAEAANLLAQDRLRHNGDGLARWCALQARTKIDSDGNARIVRGDDRTSAKRIDPLSAAVFAFDRRLADLRAVAAEDDSPQVVYNTLTDDYAQF